MNNLHGSLWSELYQRPQWISYLCGHACPKQGNTARTTHHTNDQIELSPESRHFIVFSTHIGLYRYKRLHFGVNSAAEKFQNGIKSSLSNLVGILNISTTYLYICRKWQRTRQTYWGCTQKASIREFNTQQPKNIYSVKALSQILQTHIQWRWCSIHTKHSRTAIFLRSEKFPWYGYILQQIHTRIINFLAAPSGTDKRICALDLGN